MKEQSHSQGKDVPNNSLVKGGAGAVSGAIASVLVQPLDVIKTRQQQGLVAKAKDAAVVKYKTTMETTKLIIKEEGILGLWKGTAPTLYRVIPGAGMNFFFLHYITNFLHKTQANTSEPLSKTNALIAGGTARTMATVTMLPITVVKTRFEGFGTNVYRNTFHALQTIYTQEGARGLFSGLVPSVLRDAPFAGIYFLFYTQSQAKLTELSIPYTSSTVINLVSGGWAAMVATLITHPQDMIKTRLQITPTIPTESSRERALKLCRSIYQENGIAGFYKGLTPRLIRRPLANAITWYYIS